MVYFNPGRFFVTISIGYSDLNSSTLGNLPSVGGGDDEGDKEKDLEEEKLRQEAIKEAEEKRRVKHKKMEEERENMRQGIRDKVMLDNHIFYHHFCVLIN